MQQETLVTQDYAQIVGLLERHRHHWAGSNRDIFCIVSTSVV